MLHTERQLIMEQHKETIRINGNKIRITMLSISAKDGDSWIEYAPSLNISAYGDSKEDAQMSFQENIKQFIEDIRTLKKAELEQYLYSLGWAKERLRNKNFSHVYVDENGNLNGLVIQEKKMQSEVFA